MAYHDVSEFQLQLNPHSTSQDWPIKLVSLSPTASSDCWSVGYFCLFIIATGCPSEQCPQKTVSFYGEIVQGYRTKLLRAPPSSLMCLAYSTVTRDLGLTAHLKDF